MIFEFTWVRSPVATLIKRPTPEPDTGSRVEVSWPGDNPILDATVIAVQALEGPQAGKSLTLRVEPGQDGYQGLLAHLAQGGPVEFNVPDPDDPDDE